MDITTMIARLSCSPLNLDQCPYGFAERNCHNCQGTLEYDARQTILALQKELAQAKQNVLSVGTSIYIPFPSASKVLSTKISCITIYNDYTRIFTQWDDEIDGEDSFNFKSDELGVRFFLNPEDAYIALKEAEKGR